MLKIEQLRHKTTNEPMRGFFVHNTANKVLAVGVMPGAGDTGFALMKAKRYENDADMVRAIERMTGVNVRRIYTR